MANLARRESIFNDLFDFRRDFDHMFNRLLRTGSERSDQSGQLGPAAFIPEVNAYIDKEGRKFVCQVALPGIEPKDVNIQVQGNILSIRGERTLSNERRDANYVHSELAYGSFERDILLPEGVDTDKLTAEYRSGVLEVTAPVSAAAMPRRIEVRSIESAKRASA